ncbi:hypothetical protein OROGR_004570 [Orobanche gracilis]
MPAVRMTLKNGTGQACAACKHQRRRCKPDCVLAPFFPSDQHELFQSVHRLFGVKHVQNLLKELPSHEKAIAIRSIKFHAAMREKYPVYGCLVEIQHLTYQIQLAEEELQLVLHQLDYYRQQQNQQEEVDTSPGDDCVSSKVQLGVTPPGNGNGGVLNVVHHDIVPYSKNENAGYNSTNSDYGKENNEDVDSLFMRETCRSYNNMNNADSVMLMNMMMQPNPVPQEEMMHPFFDTNIDDDAELSFIGTKEIVESPLRDFKLSTEQMAENELKSAAACFSLTSVN